MLTEIYSRSPRDVLCLGSWPDSSNWSICASTCGLSRSTGLFTVVPAYVGPGDDRTFVSKQTGLVADFSL
jgi:hypothetical protein